MSDFKFYLKAEPNFKGDLRVKEYFEQRFYNSSSKQEEIKVGHADDAVKAQHPEEYKKFSEYVEKNQEALFDLCRETGEVKFDYSSGVEFKVEEGDVDNA